jgi:excisionase family DNA binding protein
MGIDSAGGIGEREIAAARRGVDELRALVEDARRRSCAVLVETKGGRVELAADMLDSIVKVVEAATAGSGSGIEAEISPQEAAGILRMSRPSVMRLIERGHLHARMVGSHHRLSRAEILAYKDRQTRVRREALANLATLAEEYHY